MKKACMIVSAWFGHRRPDFNSPTTPSDQINFFKNVFLEHAKSVDPGINMDLVIVNNVGPPPGTKGPKDWPGEISGDYDRAALDAELLLTRGMNDIEAKKITEDSHDANEQILKLDGVSINRGVVRVFKRKNTLGKGFDAFAFGFMKTQEDYDYFLFCEDDVVFFRDNYFKAAIETLETKRRRPHASVRKSRSSSNIPKVPLACVGYSLISPTHSKPHFAGGLLMSSRENLIKVSNTWPQYLNLITRDGYGERNKFGLRSEKPIHPVWLWDEIHKNVDNATENSRLPDNENDFTFAFNFIKDEYRPTNKKTVGAWHMSYPSGLSPLARNWKDLSFQSDTIEKVKNIISGVIKTRPLLPIQEVGLREMVQKADGGCVSCFFVGNESNPWLDWKKDDSEC